MGAKKWNTASGAAFCLTYVGEMEVSRYGDIYTSSGANLIKTLAEQMEMGEHGAKFLGRLTITVEPVEGAGLHLEVK